eukprot:1578437-Amphidinium_carterae.1
MLLHSWWKEAEYQLRQCDEDREDLSDELNASQVKVSCITEHMQTFCQTWAKSNLQNCYWSRFRSEWCMCWELVVNKVVVGGVVIRRY